MGRLNALRKLENEPAKQSRDIIIQSPIPYIALRSRASLVAHSSSRSTIVSVTLCSCAVVISIRQPDEVQLTDTLPTPSPAGAVATP
jgi:hypothetical protein